MGKKSSGRKFKRGNVALEVIIIVVLLLAFGLVSLLGTMFLNDLNDDWQADLTLSNESKEILQEQTTGYPIAMDNAVITILALGWVFALIGAYLIDSHPVFFWISMVLLVFLVIGGMALSELWTELINDADLSTFAAQLPKTNFVLQRIPIFMVAIAMSVAVVLYGKSR